MSFYEDLRMRRSYPDGGQVATYPYIDIVGWRKFVQLLIFYQKICIHIMLASRIL